MKTKTLPLLASIGAPECGSGRIQSGAVFQSASALTHPPTARWAPPAQVQVFHIGQGCRRAGLASPGLPRFQVLLVKFPDGPLVSSTRAVTSAQQRIDLCNSGVGKGLRTQKAVITKGNIDKLDFFKIKTYSFSKDAVKKMKRQASDWEKMFTIHVSNKQPKYIKNVTTQERINGFNFVKWANE